MDSPEPGIEIETSDQDEEEPAVVAKLHYQPDRELPPHVAPHASIGKPTITPKVCMVASETGATYGSLSMDASDTDVPSTSDELTILEDDSDLDFDLADDNVVGTGTIDIPVLASPCEPLPVDQQDNPVCELCDPTRLATIDEACEADQDEPVHFSRRQRRTIRQRRSKFYRKYGKARASAMASDGSHQPEASEGHMDLLNLDAMKAVTKEETDGKKRIVESKEVRESTGIAQEGWKTAAEAELTSNFLRMGAFHKSTKHELDSHGTPLPMLCVWSTGSDGSRKCRACVCGNFADADPTQQ